MSGLRELGWEWCESQPVAVDEPQEGRVVLIHPGMERPGERVLAVVVLDLVVVVHRAVAGVEVLGQQEQRTDPVAVPLELVGVVEVVGVPVEAIGPDVLHFEGVPAVSFAEVVTEAARAAQFLVEPGCDPGQDVVDGSDPSLRWPCAALVLICRTAARRNTHQLVGRMCRGSHDHSLQPPTAPTSSPRPPHQSPRRRIQATETPHPTQRNHRSSHTPDWATPAPGGAEVVAITLGAKSPTADTTRDEEVLGDCVEGYLPGPPNGLRHTRRWRARESSLDGEPPRLGVLNAWFRPQDALVLGCRCEGR